MNWEWSIRIKSGLSGIIINIKTAFPLVSVVWFITIISLSWSLVGHQHPSWFSHIGSACATISIHHHASSLAIAVPGDKSNILRVGLGGIPWTFTRIYLLWNWWSLLTGESGSQVRLVDIPATSGSRAAATQLEELQNMQEQLVSSWFQGDPDEGERRWLWFSWSVESFSA